MFLFPERYENSIGLCVINSSKNYNSLFIKRCYFYKIAIRLNKKTQLPSRRSAQAKLPINKCVGERRA